MNTRPTRNFKLADIDWPLIAACRKKRMKWKEIGTLTGMDHQKLRESAAALGKTELLGCRSRVDWDLIARLYKRGKDYNFIAAKVGLTSGHTLWTAIRARRLDGRWTIPLRPRDRRAAFLKGLRAKLQLASAHQPRRSPSTRSTGYRRVRPSFSTITTYESPR